MKILEFIHIFPYPDTRVSRVRFPDHVNTDMHMHKKERKRKRACVLVLEDMINNTSDVDDAIRYDNESSDVNLNLMAQDMNRSTSRMTNAFGE